MTKFALAPIAAALILAGCSTAKIEKQADEEIAAAKVLRQQAQQASEENGLRSRDYLTHSKTPFLTSTSVDSQAIANLPVQLTTRVVFQPGQATSLGAVAERLTIETGIPIRIAPDVYAVPGASPSGSTGTPTPSPLATGTPQPIYIAALQANVDPQRLTLRPRYSGPLYALLDQIATQLGIGWRWNTGSIELFRYETRRLEYRAPMGTLKSDSSIGQSGNGSNTSGSANATQVTAGASFSTSTTMTRSSNFDPWSAIKDKVSVILSPAGRAAYDPSTGSIVVTDTHANVEQVAKLLKEENAILQLQASVNVQFIAVDINDSAEYGFDWALAFKHYADGVAQTAFNFGSPTSLVSAVAATSNYAVVTPPSGDTTLARLSGTSVAIKALADMGRSSAKRANTIIAPNRRTTPLALTSQDTYLAETTPAAGGGTTGGQGVPGLKPGVFTYGYMLSVLPTIFPDGTINLEVAGNVTNSRGIDKVETGQGETLQQIQTPKADTNDVNVSVTARSGQTIVIPVYEGTIIQSDKRSLDDGVPILFSGSYNGKATKSMVFLVITPVIKGIGI
jgi:type IVB pilus formation R64 PilN family outer membrane protein